MEDSVLIIVTVVVVVWYFGSVINSIIAKSGKMATREYEVFEREQAFRLAKGKEELKAKAEKFKAESKSTMSDEELDAFLGI